MSAFFFPRRFFFEQSPVGRFALLFMLRAWIRIQRVELLWLTWRNNRRVRRHRHAERFIVRRWVPGPHLNSRWRWETFDVIEARTYESAVAGAIVKHPDLMIDVEPAPCASRQSR